MQPLVPAKVTLYRSEIVSDKSLADLTFQANEPRFGSSTILQGSYNGLLKIWTSGLSLVDATLLAPGRSRAVT